MKTLASEINDANAAHLTVDLKSELEKNTRAGPKHCRVLLDAFRYFRKLKKAPETGAFWFFKYMPLCLCSRIILVHQLRPYRVKQVRHRFSHRS